MFVLGATHPPARAPGAHPRVADDQGAAGAGAGEGNFIFGGQGRNDPGAPEFAQSGKNNHYAQPGVLGTAAAQSFLCPGAQKIFSKFNTRIFSFFRDYFGG